MIYIEIHNFKKLYGVMRNNAMGYRPKVAPQLNNNSVNCNDDPIISDYSEPSANFCKVFFKITIVFLSFAGFLYQATDICAHYFSYRTVVYTNTKQDSLIDLPSITLCLPTYFTKKMLINLYGARIVDSLDKLKITNHSLLSAIKPLIYSHFQREAFKDLFAGDILKNSIKSNHIIQCRLYYPPLNRINLTHNELYEIVEYGIPCDEVVDQIESINANGKCFTYFSQLKKPITSDSKLFKIEANKGYRFYSGRFMKLVIELNREEYGLIFDGDMEQTECIQVHQPLEMPSFACVHSIAPGMSYDLILRQTKSILQPSPYQTDCLTYSNGVSAMSAMSRSDCIDKCIVAMYESKCKCLPIHVSIWNQNGYDNLNNTSICNSRHQYHAISQCVHQELSDKCYESCKPDCVDRHYYVQMEGKIYPSNRQISEAIGVERDRLVKMREITATINVWSDFLSDITYVHTPAMSLIQLVCYLGGLAGLWLGVSVMTVSGWLAQLFPFSQKWNHKQKHILFDCKRQSHAFNDKPQQIIGNFHDKLRYQRTSVCSLSQLNTRF